MKNLLSLITFAFCLFTFDFAVAASGCNYPTSLDSYTNKITGDYLTTADINSRSCAIEQLEIRLNQLLIGKPGSQNITGGTASGESLALISTSNATKGYIVFGASNNSAYHEATENLGLGTLTPAHKLSVVSAGTNVARFTTTGGTFGPRIDLYHNNTTSDGGGLFFYSNDIGTTQRLNSYIVNWSLDSTVASQDSEIQFCVQNNVNAGGCNTIARLSSLGVWTDSSSAVNKEYEGDIPGGAINKLKQLTTFGVYRSKDLPPAKIQNAERHYSPTAEEFHKVFGLGSDTGIAAKDVASIAAKAVLELEARVEALEKK